MSTESRQRIGLTLRIFACWAAPRCNSDIFSGAYKNPKISQGFFSSNLFFLSSSLPCPSFLLRNFVFMFLCMFLCWMRQKATNNHSFQHIVRTTHQFGFSRRYERRKNVATGSSQLQPGCGFHNVAGSTGYHVADAGAHIVNCLVQLGSDAFSFRQHSRQRQHVANADIHFLRPSLELLFEIWR